VAVVQRFRHRASLVDTVVGMTVGPQVVWMPGGVRTEVHLGAAETGGAFCMLVDQPPAGWFLPAHRHTNEDETIHVVEGEFEIEVGGETTRLAAGETIRIPKGVIHSGGNIGSRPGRRIVLFSPAGMEDFFLEAGSPTAQRAPDGAAAVASATRFGWEFVTHESSDGMQP
jgi:quercetin dioxygenase-like cupin family protein